MGGTAENGSSTATYHDTPDGRLTRAGIPLRRRMRNGVGLWEAEIGGTTVSAPGGPVVVPDEVARALVAPLRGADVVAVARMRASVEGVALLEGQHAVRSYPDERHALRDGLRSKRARDPAKRAPALDHVRSYLARQLAEIERTDPVLRLRHDEKSLHDFRVAVRRTRAVLRATKKLFDDAWVDSLRAELRWLGGELGPARDLDVLLSHLGEERDRLGSDVAPIVRRLERDRRGVRRRLLAALEGERYLSLLDALGAAVDAPPVREVDIALERVATREFRQLRKAVDSLGDRPTDAALHRTRILAKRARYAAELAAPVAGKRARRFAQAAKGFQDVVGLHQDSVVAEERVRAFAESADAAFGAGRLVERQRVRRAAARAALPGAWRKLERRGREAWS